MSLDLDLMVVEPHTVFDINITHNLNEMARALGVYEILWRPDELAENAMVDKIYVKNFLKPINGSIEELATNMDYYQSEYGPKNGWGSAETLLKDLRLIRNAIEENPDGYFVASR